MSETLADVTLETLILKTQGGVPQGRCARSPSGRFGLQKLQSKLAVAQIRKSPPSDIATKTSRAQDSFPTMQALAHVGIAGHALETIHPVYIWSETSAD